MTREDDESIPEGEMDEIVARVVEQLRETPAGRTDIEVRDEGGGEHDERDDDAESAEADARERAEGRREEARERGEGRREEARERGEGRREEAREREREARERAREARSGGLEDLGDRIEAAVEAQLEGVAESIERSFGDATPEPQEPPAHGVTIGPGDTSEKAVYKTQLQKGGRVAVPDAEMDALGLEPGDTLQVVLYPV
jgi:hypothetical protein